ncbi:MAG: hypothetical protein LBU38_01020 [Propionibacteriaceae bacterium]|nr:hypothetical protein [Propionibacteriaceae bacterium]
MPAGQTKKVTVGPVSWIVPNSLWWPNIPYVEGYRAQLHNLDVTATVVGSEPSTSHVRFGFREIEQVGDGFELNGVPINFRGDSPQGADYDNIDNYGRGDAFDTLPGFLRPSASNPGWEKVIDNYQRLNYNSVRIHQEPASPYMLDVADEMGMILMDESAIRGSNGRESLFSGRDNMVKHVQDLVLRDRNHASVLRWSQANEPTTGTQSPFPAPGYSIGFDRELYKAVMALDDTRPISTDGNSPDLDYDNYTVYCHYWDVSWSNPDRFTESTCPEAVLPGKPHGSGEHIWNTDNTPRGFMQFATSTQRMRVNDAADIRPYTLLSAWASLVPGVRSTDMTIEGNLKPLYGEDNLPDPWSHPTVQRIQKAFSPLLVSDNAYWDANKRSNSAGVWPAVPVALERGASVTRTLTVFNDLLNTDNVTLNWAVRSGSATGDIVASGSKDLFIPRGSDKDHEITFTVPKSADDLYLVLSAQTAANGTVFTDDGTKFATVEPAPGDNTALRGQSPFIKVERR